MKIKINNKYNKNGSALAYALVIMAVVAIILSSLLQYISAQLKFSFYKGDREQAFQIAESGMYFYRWYLAHSVSGKTAQQIKDFWQSGTAYGVNQPYEAEFFDPEGGAIGKYQIQVQPPDPSSTIVIARATGWTYKEPNTKRIIQARFRRPSWSEFMVTSNDVVKFGSGTGVYGKVHSNNGIQFNGIAHNVVSSGLYRYDDPDHRGAAEFGVHTHMNPPPSSGGSVAFRPNEAPPNTVQNRSDIFYAGRQFPVPVVDFNGVIADLNYMKTESQISGHGIYFDNAEKGRRIILKNNGTFDMCAVNSYNDSTYSISKYAGIVTGATGSSSSNNGSSCVSSSCCAGSSCPNIVGNAPGVGKCETKKNYDIIDNGVIFVENNAWVEGIIDNKKITIVAADLASGAKDIYLGMDNLLYTNFDGKDVIGLIAQNNISIVADSPSTLTINAALLAQTGRFGRNWYPNNLKDKITIYGSVATNLRYGLLIGFQGVASGYQERNFNFDNNLLYYPPPYFPTGTEYSIDLWDEV